MVKWSYNTRGDLPLKVMHLITKFWGVGISAKSKETRVVYINLIPTVGIN